MQPISSTEKETLQQKAAEWLNISVSDAAYLVFDGIAENRMYNTKNERINILFKDGTVKDISEVEYGLIHLTGGSPAQKFYLCAPGEILKKQSVPS